MNRKKTKILNSLCAFALALMMVLSSFGGLIEVKAAGVPVPTIDKVFYGATTLSGAGVHRAKVGNKIVRGVIHVELMRGNGTKASSVINPIGRTWEWKLPENIAVEPGDRVIAYQKFDGQTSAIVNSYAEPSMAYNYKSDLKMPSGEIWIENTNADLVNKDEQVEAEKMLKDANVAIVGDIKSVKFTIDGINHAYYEISYTDGSVSAKVEAADLKIKQVTETSATPTIEKVQVADWKIVITLDKEVAPDTKFYFIKTFTDGEENNFCKNKNCNITKSNLQEMNEAELIDGKKVIFPVNDDDLKLRKEFGIIVKEPHKFRSCDKSEPVIAVPDKLSVKDPKKLKPEEKEAIAEAVRKANTTESGKSKLPKDPYDGTPAFIEISDDGKVKIINPIDMEIDRWDSVGSPIYAKNPDGTFVVIDGHENNVLHFDKPEELLSNLPPNAPTIENKEGKVVITPNTEVDTDAKKVIVEFKGEDGYSKTIVAEKTDTGWTVNNTIAKVNEKGVVTIPTKSIKHSTTITASVEDNGGLTPEETVADSGKTELLIKGSYKVTYKAGEGSKTMPKTEVEAGEEYTILESTFTPPNNKEFDFWQVGSEKKNAGDKIIINNDTEITAIYKYIIGADIRQIETKVDHPVSYNMYISAFINLTYPLKIEHIEVIEAPDISKVGQTEAKIEIRYSDGQFRAYTVKVNVIKDPKDITIEGLNNKVTELNATIDGLNTSITEKDTKIAELNSKITELENQLKTCQEQCAADKAQCEKDKAVLQKQIDELTTAKTALEEQAKKDAQTIEELRKQIENLKGQLEECKKASKEKDSKIKELEDSIKDLNTKLETANNANKELTRQLETANQKIKDLEAQIEALKTENADLKNKITELGNTIKTKDTEINTLKETVTSLKEQIAKLETEKAKDKEQYEKDKSVLQEKLEKANQDLKDKNTELDKIKAELEQAKKDLAAEQTKNAGLEEKVTNLEEQLKALQGKLNTAAEDLKTANNKILELEKQVTEKETENKALTEQVEKLGKDLEAKTNEVNNLNARILELEKQVSEKTAQGVADKAEIERLTKELEDLKKQLADKNTELEKLRKEATEAKEKAKEAEGKNSELVKTVDKLEKEITELKETIKTSSEKITQLEKENSTLKEANKDLNEKVTDLTEKVKEAEDENTTLKAKIEELNKQLAEAQKSQCDVEELNKLKQDKAALEATVKGKDELIQELRNQIAELKKSLTDKDKEYEEKIKELEEKINRLTTKNTSLKEQLATANQKITDLETLLQAEKDKNRQLEEENGNNKKEIQELETAKKTLEEEKAKIEEKSKELENKVEAVEKEKEQLSKDKEALEAEVERLKKELEEKPDNCPTCDTKELEDKIAELEKTIKNQKNNIAKKDKEIADLKEKLANSPTDTSKLDKQIADLNERIKQLQGKLADKEKELNSKTNDYVKEKETWKKEKDNFIRDRWNNYNYWGDYRPNYNRERELEYDNDSLKHKNSDLARENKELKERNSKLESISNREEYVTIFYLDETLYKTFLGREFLTQAEMTDSKGYIKPFVSNNRTMLPIRYLALSLGMDVKWDQKTRIATFSNYKNNNVLNRGSVTINADTLEMKDQNGRIIYVDAKPVLINGRFYVSIINVTKAFGGSNGNINDGIKNTIEWNAINREVLVYKNIK